VHCKGTDYAAFLTANSSFKPPVFSSTDATIYARSTAVLRYIMPAARFAHYLRCLWADKFMSFHSREANEQFLNRWISRYVRAEEPAEMKYKAQFPLSRTHRVTRGARKRLRISPRFQLGELPMPLVVTFTLPK
jgi:type VI secretion system protein ImpC